MSIDAQGFVMAADSPATWFLDTSMRALARREHTGGAFTFIQWAAPVGFSPPRHIHPTEDEAFYLIEGRMDVVCGADQWAAGPGDFVFLPKGVPPRLRGDRRTRRGPAGHLARRVRGLCGRAGAPRHARRITRPDAT